MDSSGRSSSFYVPIDPRAYLVRYGLRAAGARMLLAAGFVGLTALVVTRQDGGGHLAVLVLLLVPFTAVVAVVFGRGLARAVRGEVGFAVDRVGVFIGPAGDGDSASVLVEWPNVAAVVLFRRRKRSSRRTYWRNEVGVLLRPGSPGVPPPGLVDMIDAAIADPHGAGRVLWGGPLPPHFARYSADLLAAKREAVIFEAFVRSRSVDGLVLDRARLTDAVNRYAPAVPVIDGPDLDNTGGWADVGRLGLAIAGDLSTMPVDTSNDTATAGATGSAGGRPAPPWPTASAGGDLPPAPAPPRSRPRIRVSPAGCLVRLLVVPAIWLLVAALPTLVLDDLLGQALHVRWALWQDRPTVVSVRPGTVLAVEISAERQGRRGGYSQPIQAITCATRDGTQDEVALPRQLIVPVPHGQRETARPYVVVTRSGRLEVRCTWSGFEEPSLTRVGVGWFGVLTLACRLLWLALATLGLLLVLRRIRRRDPTRHP
jgi:hypothetical protein